MNEKEHERYMKRVIQKEFKARQEEMVENKLNSTWMKR